MSLKDVFISSAWSFHWMTEESCGNEGDLSPGSEVLNYLVISASKHMTSEPWFQQVEGVLLGPPLLVMKGQIFLPREDSSHQFSPSTKPFCLAMQSSFPAPCPITSAITCLLCGHDCSEKTYIIVRIKGNQKDRSVRLLAFGWTWQRPNFFLETCVVWSKTVGLTGLSLPCHY